MFRLPVPRLTGDDLRVGSRRSSIKILRGVGMTSGKTMEPHSLTRASHETAALAAVLTLLREQGIRYEDLTSCVGKLGVSELYSEGRRHYSAKGNERVSTCLYPMLRDYLSREPRAARGGT